MTPTTPVRPRPVTISSQPKALSFSSTKRAVSWTSNRSSGRICRSRRHAAISGCISAARLRRGMCLRSLLLFRSLDRFPDAQGRRRHVDLLDAGFRERILDAVHHRGKSADCSGLARPLHADLVVLGQDLDRLEIEEGDILGARYCVVHERTGEKLAVLAVDGVLMDRLADALNDAAMHLAGDQ